MAQYTIIQNFYSKKIWRDFRLTLIAERGPVCQRCGKLISKPINIIAHHTIELTPENVNDYNISLNPDLVELVCRDCHEKEHERFGNEKEKRVFIVYGCPLSGKTTFVRQNKGRRDIVIDIDQLYKAITFLDDYDKPDRFLSNIRRVQNDLLDQIKVRYGKWSQAWIIGGYADKYKREKLAEDLGAELIFMECTKAEALSRLETDEARRHIKIEYKGYIERWFDKYVA